MPRQISDREAGFMFSLRVYNTMMGVAAIFLSTTPISAMTYCFITAVCALETVNYVRVVRKAERELTS